RQDRRPGNTPSDAAARASPLDTVVRRFLGDDHVVHVALAHAGRGDPHELRVPLQGGDVGAATVAHAGPQAAHQLVDHRRDAALVGHASLDAFRHELVAAVAAAFQIELVLEVAVAAAAAHRAERSHAAVFLEAAPLIQDDFARALVGPGEEAADHDGAGPDGQCLRDVARIADASVGDDRHARALRGARALGDGRDHRHADAGHDARRAD